MCCYTHSFLTATLLLTAFALAGTVDPPIRVTDLPRLDGSKLNGLIISFTDNDFELMDAKKQTQTVPWEELPAGSVINLNERLIRKGSGDQWMKLGEKLLTMPGGRAPAERAFQKAVKIDPALKDTIADLRKQANISPPPPASSVATQGRPRVIPEDEASATQPTVREPTAGERTTQEPKDPSRRVVGPQQVGALDPSQWGKQSAEQSKAAIAKLQQFAEETKKTVNPNLQSYETEYFLFYTDLPLTEAGKWMGTLDRMYARLAGLFGVAKEQNIWRGKALVFVFGKEDDYLNFQIKMHKTVAAGSAGMCHAFGNGDVHIAFYRQPNDLDFAHVLVHESTHGFLHRYRSPVSIPSWINEGLAEVIASELVPRQGVTQSATAEARQELQTRKNLGKMLEANHIVAWQYPVARTLTEFMIRQNKQGYVDWINAIKDGDQWEDALSKKYGVTVEQLVNAYGISMGVKDLKP